MTERSRLLAQLTDDLEAVKTDMEERGEEDEAMDIMTAD